MFFLNSSRNFLVIDVYFSALKYEEVEQLEAYGTMPFLSKCNGTSKMVAADHHGVYTTTLTTCQLGLDEDDIKLQ